MQINLHLLALIPIFVLQNVTRAMVTLDAIRGPVAQELEEFDAFVRRNFKVENELLSGMVDYILSSRGKGVRPLLVLLSAALNAPAGGCPLRRSRRRE